MNKQQWEIFCKFRSEFKNKCEEWGKLAPQLKNLQIQAAKKDTPDYPLENPVVYNTSLDSITENDEINLIVIGDNPGKNEQLEKNKKYLVGMAGKIAEGFFKKNPELETDFRKNVIILNKTPIHTAKTNHLKYLSKNGTDEIQKLIHDSQIWMAEKTARFHQDFLSAQNSALSPEQNTDNSSCKRAMELWLVGYAELKNNGIFLPYKEAFFNCYKKDSEMCEAWQYVKVYQHFSMNRFSIDLNDFKKNENKLEKMAAQTEQENLSKIPTAKNFPIDLKNALEILGERHKKEIFN